MALTKLNLTIKKEDILKEDYTDSYNCPITKALARAGRPDLIEAVGIHNRKPDGKPNKELLSTQGYHEAEQKMFRMYGSFNSRFDYIKDPEEPADIEFTIEFEE